LGSILEPEFTTKHGISPIDNAVLVNKAGVGIPSGVAGTPEIEKHFPQYRYSESAAGVYLIRSGFAPAKVIPETWLVSV